MLHPFHLTETHNVLFIMIYIYIYNCFRLSVAESELAYSHYDEIKDEIKETEAFIKQQNQKQVMFRVQSQTRHLIEVQRYNQLHEKMKFNLVREKEEEVKIVMEKMKQAQENGRKFLHETSERYLQT